MIDIRSWLALLLPAACECCGEELTAGERLLCMNCRAEITACDATTRGIDITLRDRLPLDANIAMTGVLGEYRAESELGRLIRKGKYGDRPDILVELGRMLGNMLKRTEAITSVGALLPVPMHRWKRLKRGYNQADIIAREVSSVTGIPLSNAVRAARPHKSQTRSSGAGRAVNVSDIFEVRNIEEIAGRHIAVIDDIITTGATMSSIIRLLTNAGAARISAFAIAGTKVRN